MTAPASPSVTFGCSSLSPDALQRFEFFDTLFDLSGEVLRPAYRCESLATESKEMISPLVTAADRAVERVLREAIHHRFPTDGIVGEEEAPRAGSSLFEWVIDPIDGTSSLVRGLPLFGTLIGLIDKSSGTIVCGGADQPILGERILARRGVPPRWNGAVAANRHNASTPTNTALTDACVCATTPLMFTTSAEQRVRDAVMNHCRRSAWGGDWFNYILMIGGKSTIPLVIVEAGLQFYDICALVPIIEEAGGVITNWDGEPITESTTQVLAAPNRALGEALQQLVADARGTPQRRDV